MEFHLCLSYKLVFKTDDQSIYWWFELSTDRISWWCKFVERRAAWRINQFWCCFLWFIAQFNCSTTIWYDSCTTSVIDRATPTRLASTTLYRELLLWYQCKSSLGQVVFSFPRTEDCDFLSKHGENARNQPSKSRQRSLFSQTLNPVLSR